MAKNHLFHALFTVSLATGWLGRASFAAAAPHPPAPGALALAAAALVPDRSDGSTAPVEPVTPSTAPELPAAPTPLPAERPAPPAYPAASAAPAPGREASDDSLAPNHGFSSASGAPVKDRLEKASEPPKPTLGFLDFNVYPYLSEVKSDSVFTVNAFAKLLFGFSYSSLTNVLNQDKESPFGDTTGFYTEQNLRWSFPAQIPFDLTFQANMRSGPDNDRYRFGFRWRADGTPGLDKLMKKIALTYSANFHALQIDHDDRYVWQIEHVARLDTPYLDRRAYLAAFCDHTFNQGYAGIPANPIVLEAQLGLRVIDEAYLIAEYRVNQYRVGSESNIGVGAEYVVKW